MRKPFFIGILMLAAFSNLLAQSYNFGAVDRLLTDSLSRFNNTVCVVVKQDDSVIYYYNRTIDSTSVLRMASATKMISGSVVLKLAEKGLFSLNDTVGRYLLVMTVNYKGRATIRNCFSMSSGSVAANQNWETDSTLALAQSVDSIAIRTPMIFSPGGGLGYDGKGMQVVGRVAEIGDSLGRSWRTIAEQELFQRLGMTNTRYNAFGNINPAVAGGITTTAVDYLKLLKMIARNGVFNGDTVLTPSSINEMFTNHTRGLPLYKTPWPIGPFYTYGEDTLRYSFGTWVLAEHPQTNHVEELTSPGAWGSYPWVDQKRNIYGVVFTFIPVIQGGYLKDIWTVLRAWELIRQEIDRATSADGERDFTHTPAKFELMQNYPNPFNPTTTIRFSLPRREYVALKIFDVFGREVATLVDGELHPGEHSVVFDARGLTSDVYFYQLRAAGFIQTKKMLISK